jgi:hypothetical protein
VLRKTATLLRWLLRSLPGVLTFTSFLLVYDPTLPARTSDQIEALVLSKEARVMLLAELELTRVTAARGSGVDVDLPPRVLRLRLHLAPAATPLPVLCRSKVSHFCSKDKRSGEGRAKGRVSVRPALSGLARAQALASSASPVG